MNRFMAPLAAVIVGCSAANAQTQADAEHGFPQRPMRFVVPFSAAGGTTAVARIVATKMSEAFGQPVVVDNRPGAQGIIASEHVQKAAPDGYTVLVGGSGSMTANPAVYSKLPYQTLRDFTPVRTIGSFPFILVVNASLPINSIRELIEYANARPRSVNYGSAGTIGQLASEYFNQQTGTRFQHIPYKGSGEFLSALLSNEITFVFSDPPPALSLVRAGKLRAIGITASRRHRAWPDVPTMAEAGIPGIAVEIWEGLLVPARTPAPVVRKIHDEVARVIALTEVRERLAELGFDPSGVGGLDFAKIIAADIARWTAVAKAANIKAD